jgi:hypothetical protein
MPPIDTEFVTADNWQELVHQSLGELPATIQPYAGFKVLDDRRLVILTSGDAPELQKEQTLTYFATERARQEHLPQSEKHPDDILDAHDGFLRKQLDWPILEIETHDGEVRGTFVYKNSTIEFKHYVQLIVAKALFDSGIIGQLDDGRFCGEDDDNPLFDWQEAGEDDEFSE